MDCTGFVTHPIKLIVPNKLVASVHDYPASVQNNLNTNVMRNAAWGFLVTQNIAPVWVGEMGASLDGSNNDIAGDRAWASALIPYLNGQGGAGCPTTPVSTCWWAWGYLRTDQPSGTLNADGTLVAAKQAFWSQLQYRGHGHIHRKIRAKNGWN